MQGEQALEKEGDEKVKLKYSCYYSHQLTAKPGKPKGRTYKHKRFGTYRDKIIIEVHVDPRQNFLADVEASALLASYATLGDVQGIGLARIGKSRYRASPDAPFGVGCKGQPLILRRDIAHGNRAKWIFPFGTRLTVTKVPENFQMDNVLFVADRFGENAEAEQLDYRIDCFTGTHVGQFDWMEADIEKPWRGPKSESRWARLKERLRIGWSGVISNQPVRGFQQCCNLLQISGPDRKPLKPDNGYGDKSKFAMKVFCGNDRISGFRGTEIPTDPEIFWTVRDAARETFHELGKE